MTVLLALLMVLAFAIVDILIRVISRRVKAARALAERREALEVGLKLDFTHEARTLKRVEVADPLARILAVDDEMVVLDSFRKILVVAGYSIDTVESGREALGLVQKRSYDFVFTDLKMPEMDGLDVVKGVKHFSPDSDVVVITGYATIQSAVDSMKHGAMDYVEKPFSEDELVAFTKKCLLRRRDRLERWVSATVHVTTGAEAPAHELLLPGGVFVSPGHVWVSIQASGMVRLGLDDLVAKALGPVDRIEPPIVGRRLAVGAPLFAIGQGARQAGFLAPLAGMVHEANPILSEDPAALQSEPFGKSWVCTLKPEDLARDLTGLRIGEAAAAWYGEELRRLAILLGTESGAGTRLPLGSLESADDRIWGEFVAGFLAGKG